MTSLLPLLKCRGVEKTWDALQYVPIRLGISLYFLSLYLFQTHRFLSDGVGMGGIALLRVIAFVLLQPSPLLWLKVTSAP